MKINFNNLIKVTELKEAEIEDIDEQLEYLKEATAFLLSHKWCDNIVESWYDKGWAGILAVFLFKIIPKGEGVDTFVWVITGDLPPAYIDIDSALNGTCAIKAYTDIMEDWVDCVFKKKNVAECYPINVPPTKEYAKMLKTRIDFIRKEILSLFPEDLKAYKL